MNMRRAITWVLVGVAIAVSCGERSGSDPFRDGGPDARAGRGGEGGEDGDAGEAGAPPVLGGPCLDDTQCNDENGCTTDVCDARYDRCRNDPDDAACDDGVFCNGAETCDRMLGCRAGPVMSCTDTNTCTIDVCVESSKSCRHEPRDADGDGDPSTSCYGADCDDLDPLISSSSSERCGNERDDDCDGAVDEDGCTEPAHDRCGDALSIEAEGTYLLSTRAAGADFSLSCTTGDEFRDVVVAVIVPEGGPRDVDIVATTPAELDDSGRPVPALSLAATERCGNAASETACDEGVFVTEVAETTARLLLRALEPGAHAIYVAANRETDVTLTVGFREPAEAPHHLTCGTAVPLPPGTPARAILAGLPDSPASRCPRQTGGLYYSLVLEEPRDVRVRGVALDTHGAPVISLRNEDCTDFDDEITCRWTDPSQLFARALPAGRYVIAVAGTGPAEVELVLSLSDPTEAPPTEGCADPPLLTEGVSEVVDLTAHTDAVQIGCIPGAADATFALELPERSDVMLVHMQSPGVNAVMIAEAPCELPMDVLSCENPEEFPMRTVAYDVPAGSVRAIIENTYGSPAKLTAFRRPATNTVVVLGADECADAVEIPETGGRFEGNTANVYADYAATCDYGGQSGPGAPDQMLHLSLSEPRRVIFDMQGSSYDTLVTVRRDDGCPGEEIEGACAVGYVEARSFLDWTLDAGAYNVQIDGYNGANGRWVLDVFTAAP